ncbi:HAMP domain-containing protein [Rhodocyclus tenuis]|uniref:histidine kinase n=2 Tax=Rhodocyclus TaxID=1064 RepID=A0A6L5JZS3_RHOTE|nr:ATP-binding protein [Rhodocyclus gracilis]MQY52659.1 HAMP domain-containing protein [Rhodocyclus gracilis]MRD73351.1 HAMP domain-containing protein [Rhodocyclus gracilis]NJA88541.1 HAMP domain-containing protein [Rhodocyclus gracilis]
MFNWGIRTRVVLLALLPAVAIAASMASYVIYRTSNEFERDLRDFGIGLSRQLAAVAGFSTYSGDHEALRNIAHAALGEPNVISAAIFDAEGTLIASSSTSTGALTPIPLDDRPLVLSNDERRIVFAAPIAAPPYEADDPLIAETAGARPPTPSSGTIGWITLTISRDAAERRKSDALFFTLLSSLLVLAFGGGLALVLGRQVTRPILRLERAVARIQSGELNARVPANSGGDLQRLEEGMNAMAEAISDGRARLEARIHEATRELQSKKEEAELASVAKSRFLAAASHDLRQPLHALSLFAADLQRAAETPEQQRLANRIAESAGAMGELLDALLDISRLDIGGVNVHYADTDIGEVLTRLDAAFGRSAAAAGLRLRCRPTSLHAVSDAVLLERLLSNLVANAIRYTERGSVLIAARKRGDGVCIEVRDSGVGIALEHQRGVFEEFFQVDNSARVRGEGLGLGLAIVARLARLLDAQISLCSQLGTGSVFRVTLPAQPTLTAKANGADEAPAHTPDDNQPPGLPLLPAPTDETDAPLRVLLLPPAGGELRTAAALASDWGYVCDWITADAFGKAQAMSGPTALLALASTFTPRDDIPASLPLILLGGEGAPPPGAHRLSVPLRPAKLRALLAQLASEANGSRNG